MVDKLQGTWREQWSTPQIQYMLSYIWHQHCRIVAFSRCIVGWEVDDTLDTRMVINALKKAFKVAKPQILNSDQGCQFTSQQYIDFVKENGIRQSMDGKSRWADNIMIERWFRSFKYEEAYLTQYNNIKEARAAIGQYIHTYNFERRHSALDYQTPAECYYPAMLMPYVA